MVASIASPIVTRALTAVEQPHAPITHVLCDLISPETAENERIAQKPAQPFEKARFAEGKDDIILRVAPEPKRCYHERLAADSIHSDDPMFFR
jgi:hypothetical protein